MGQILLSRLSVSRGKFGVFCWTIQLLDTLYACIRDTIWYRTFATRISRDVGAARDGFVPRSMKRRGAWTRDGAT